MKRYEFHDFHPEDETVLRGALFQYGNTEITEQVRALQQRGIYLETPLILYGDPRGAPCDQLAKLMSQLEREITEQLQSAALIAFGYTGDTIAGPQPIPCDLWRHVQVSINKSGSN